MKAVRGWLMSACLLCVLAPAAIAQGGFGFSILKSDNLRAGATARWKLLLAPPAGFAIDDTSLLTLTLTFPPGASAARPGYSTTGKHPLGDITDQFPGHAYSSYSDTAFGDPVTGGVKIVVNFRHRNFWFGGTVDTFSFNGIVNRSVANVAVFDAQMKHFNTVVVNSTSIVDTVVAGYLATYRVYEPVFLGLAPKLNAGSSVGNKNAGDFFYVQAVGTDRFDNFVDTSLTALTITDSSGLEPSTVASPDGNTCYGNFTVHRATPSTYLIASDGVRSGRSGSFSVAPGFPATFRFPQLPMVAIANNPFPVTIEARDAWDNLSTGYYGSPVLSDTRGGVPTTQIGPFQKGSFSLNLTIANPYTADSLRCSDGQYQASGTSPAFNVVAQSLADFDVTLPGTAPVVAGKKFLIRLRARDAAGYTIPNYAGSVNLADLTGTLSPTLVTGFSGGIRQDSVAVTRATTQDRVTVSDGAGHTGISPTFNVVPGPTSRLLLSGYPLSVEVNTLFPLTVTAVDAYDNITPAATGPVTLDDRKHKVAPTSTGALVGGVWSGQVQVTDTTANDILTGKLLPGNTVTGSTGLIQILPRQLVSFTVSGGGQVRTAGSAFPVLIQALDSQGSVVADFTGSVTLSDDSGTLAPTTSGPFAAGTATVEAVVTRSGPDKISVSDGVGHTGQSGNFSVVAGALKRFTFTLASGTRKAGVAFPILMTAVDSFANVVSTFAGVVNLGDATGTLSPPQSGPFQAGGWSGNVTIGRGTPADLITATYANLPASTSSSFPVDGRQPQLLAVNPPALGAGQGSVMGISGHNFEPGVTVTAGAGVNVSAIQLVSPDSISARFDVAAGALPAPRLLTVSNFNAPETTSALFRVGARAVVNLVTPARLSQAGQAHVTVSGSFFEVGSGLDLGSGVTVDNIQFLNFATLTADVRVDSAAVVGARTTQVTNSQGPTDATGLFQVLARSTVAAVGRTRGDSGVLDFVARGSGFDPTHPDTLQFLGATLVPRAPSDSTLTFVFPDSMAGRAGTLRARSFGAWSVPLGYTVPASPRGDVDWSGGVDLSDLPLEVAAILARTSFSGRAYLAADADANGTLDVRDLVTLLALASAAPGRIESQGLPQHGIARWDAAHGLLTPPEGAVALEWNSASGPEAGALSSAIAVMSWHREGGQLRGMAALLAPGALALPPGTSRPEHVWWSDARGVTWEARVEGASAGRLAALGNPQRGLLRLAIPARSKAITLDLFGIRGERLAARELEPGNAAEISWEVSPRLAAGVYVVRMRGEGPAGSARFVYLP